MFNYTKSAVNDTFDLIKRLIYIFQMIVQLVYIGYIIVRLVNNYGHLIANIILLVITLFYLVYLIISTKEFYTKEQKFQKDIVRWIFKSTKYIVNITIITLAVISLLNGTKDDNATMLVTVLMIVGIIASFVFDVMLILIEKQKKLIKHSLLYDIELFKKQHFIASFAIKKVGFDLDKEFPEFDDEKAIKRVKKVHYRQQQKKIRKRDFHRSNK